MARAAPAWLLALLVATATGCEADAPAGPLSADLPRGDGFDFYVLSLSWSPSYCKIEGDDANRQQCDSGRYHRFVVHGLWPQFERGWPESCGSEEPDRVPDDLVRDYLDIMPSAGLIGHQWRKHGTCTGLSQADYLAVTRAARERVDIPSRYEEAETALTVAPADVERDFTTSNPGLGGGAIAVACEASFVSEVRICMTKDLAFRPCPEVDARGCRARSATMPAPQG